MSFNTSVSAHTNYLNKFLKSCETKYLNLKGLVTTSVSTKDAHSNDLNLCVNLFFQPSGEVIQFRIAITNQTSAQSALPLAPLRTWSAL